MKKVVGLIGVLVLAILMFINGSKDDDFDFILQYNVDGKDVISTFDNTLTQDTIEGIMTIDFELSKADMKKIKEAVEALGIMEEDFKNLPSSNIKLSPSGKYMLKIQMDGETKVIHWVTSNANPIIDLDGSRKSDEELYERASKLFRLKNLIVDIIKEYEELEALPAHKLYL